MADRIGQQVGNYRLLRLLGEGGFAEVYLGEHVHLGTQAAIKVLSASLSSDEVDQFRAEARIIARLKHPQIVRLLDFGVEGEVPFLVMEYAPGGTLRQRHPAGSRLTPAEVLPYVQQMASALHYAHDQRLIHRDVKPENMLLNARGDLLLSDFGIALVVQSSRLQNTQEVAGTLAYMAPEQLQGHPRPASDQYSLGVVVYEWLAGERPFKGGMSEVVGQHLSRLPQPLREHVPSLSPVVEQVVLTALAKDPRERFASMQAFARAFEQASIMASMLPVTTHPIERPTAASDMTIQAQHPPTSGALQAAPTWQAAPAARAETSGSQPRPPVSPPALPSPPKHKPKRRWARVLLGVLVVVVLLAGGGLAWRTLLAGKPVPGRAVSVTGTATGSKSFTEFSIPNVDRLVDLTVGPDGTLWFTGSNASGWNIGHITPAGQISLFSLEPPSGSIVSAWALTTGPDGALWFTACLPDPAGSGYCLGGIGRMTPDGKITLFALPTKENFLPGITAGPDGNFWFTAFQVDNQGQDAGDAIWRVTPTGQFTEFPLSLPLGGFDFQGITAGPDGNLWFTSEGIGRITPAGKITMFSNNLSDIITTGPDGNLWFTTLEGIGRITPAGTITNFPVPAPASECSVPADLANSAPFGLAAGPDGNLWFTVAPCAKIGRMTPSGTVTEFALPTSAQPKGSPWIMVTGPDGNLWFLEQGTNTIGRFTPGA